MIIFTNEKNEKRDVVAEHFDTIIKSPCVIEKGMVNDIDNPLLYNRESMTYNQIKSAEYKLKDPTGCGWIVGYVPKNEPNATTVSNTPTIQTTILLEGTPSIYYDPEDLPFDVSTNTTYAFDSSQMEIEFLQLGSYMDTEYAGDRYGKRMVQKWYYANR